MEVFNNVTKIVKDDLFQRKNANSAELIYFMTLYNIFSEFLEDISEDVLPNRK